MTVIENAESIRSSVSLYDPNFAHVVWVDVGGGGSENRGSDSDTDVEDIERRFRSLGLA